MAETSIGSAGWKVLPDELRLRILKFALADDDAVANEQFKTISNTCLRPFLDIPELANIATEAFYTGNTFMVKLAEYKPISDGRAHDPGDDRYLFRLCLKRLRSDWVLFYYLRNIPFGSNILPSLNIVIDFRSHPFRRHELQELERAIRSTILDTEVRVGRLVVTYVHRKFESEEDTLVLYDTLESLIFDKFMINGASTDREGAIREKYERYYITEGGMKVNVKDWVKDGYTPTDTDQRYTKRTQFLRA